MLRVVTKSSFHTLSCDKPLSIEMYLNSIYSYLKMFILLLRKIDKNFMYNNIAHHCRHNSYNINNK